MTEKSLKQIVLNHLKRYKSITGIYFAKRFGSTRLAVYISRLRYEGHDIKCEEIVKNKRYKYVLYE